MIRISLAAILGLFLFAGESQASVIVAPVSATQVIGGANATTANLIKITPDLSSPYTATGGPEFDNYLATTPTHDGTIVANNYTFTFPFPATSTIEFDMGVEIKLGRMALWNAEFGGDTGSDLASMLVSYSTDGVTFSAPMAFAVGTVEANGGNSAQRAQVFDISGVPLFVPARFVRLTYTATQGSIFSAALGEVAFEHVPEPSSLALLAIPGIVGLVVVRRRRRKNDSHKAA